MLTDIFKIFIHNRTDKFINRIQFIRIYAEYIRRNFTRLEELKARGECNGVEGLTILGRDALRRQEELAAQLEDARAQLRQAQARLEELEQRLQEDYDPTTSALSVIWPQGNP